MDMLKLFSIGDMAKLFHISVSSIRHYEDIGCITPEYTDPSNGYRYYSTRQFEALNTIRYLRALDMPLSEIVDFLGNRDVELIEEKLLQQKAVVIEKYKELKRIEKKIDNRLNAIDDARNSVFDTVRLIRKAPCRMVWVDEHLKINGFLDMETQIRKLEKEQAEAVVFLGKVGLGISEENLCSNNFDSYDGIFLILDDEDNFYGKTISIPETLCVSVRFHGSHTESPEQYRKLADYINENHLKINGFSREVTMIDYGITNYVKKFVTEISIPIMEY